MLAPDQHHDGRAPSIRQRAIAPFEIRIGLSLAVGLSLSSFAVENWLRR
jgi:hypothetical protein